MTGATADIGSARLAELAERLDAQDGYAEVIASLRAGHWSGALEPTNGAAYA